ncbi:CCDC162P [Bugula neritina]|uniref:CCDC162P n=1 Tax=Bugula neritina TaxID=10212 RepID=A0A7J7KPX7_BUGNE|nr:CCDC162P [Bugula neritina]
MTDNGEQLLNLWFIPHHSELLIMFKHLPHADCIRALEHLCKVAAALHDIMQYLCAHSKLGSSQALLGSQKLEFVSADWGGTEGIGKRIESNAIAKHLLL